MGIGISNYINSGYRYGMERTKQPSCSETEFFSSAVTKIEKEGEGEFLGITMIPEEGQSTVYGMRAMLSEESTPDKPIVQIISNLNGKKEVFNVDINSVNPKNASRLEMFALCSYADKMGQGTGSTFGSFQTLKIYEETAKQNGCTKYVELETSSWEQFHNEKVDWMGMVEQVCNILKDSNDTKVLDLFMKGKKLLNMCSKYSVGNVC